MAIRVKGSLPHMPPSLQPLCPPVWHACNKGSGPEPRRGGAVLGTRLQRKPGAPWLEGPQGRSGEEEEAGL